LEKLPGALQAWEATKEVYPVSEAMQCMICALVHVILG